MKNLINHYKVYYLLIIFFFTCISVFLSSYTPDAATEPTAKVEYIPNLFEYSFDDTLNEQYVFAGRTEEAEHSEYNSLALPKDRYWLTAKEWRGSHIKTMDKTLKEKRLLTTRFKAWKAMHIKEFIEHMGAAAQEEHKQFPDIMPSIYIAQSLIESNFGLSRLAIQGKNMYGHKWRGKNTFLVCADDSPTDRFSVFISEWHSIRAHSYLLMRKYRKRIKGKPSLNKWLTALCGAQTTAGSKAFVDAGNSVYATSCFTNVCYAQKLKRIINHYNLRRFD